MSEMTTYRWTFEEDVLAYRASGIEAIGVWRKKLEEYGEERGAELLRENGLRVSSLSFAGGFTGADGHSFREGVDDARDAVEIAAEIGADSLIVVAGARAGHTKNHARRLLRDALLELGDFAGIHGVQIVVQPLHRTLGDQWSFLNSTELALDTLERCDHSNLGIALDLFHMGREISLISRIPQLAPWIKTVLISDAPADPKHDLDRLLPGFGVLPIASILQALDNAGYSGWYDLQILSEELWSMDYHALLQQSRDAFQSVSPVRRVAESRSLAGEGSPPSASSVPAVPCPTDS